MVGFFKHIVYKVTDVAQNLFTCLSYTTLDPIMATESNQVFIAKNLSSKAAAPFTIASFRDINSNKNLKFVFYSIA